jgi:hypothetical protein
MADIEDLFDEPGAYPALSALVPASVEPTDIVLAEKIPIIETDEVRRIRADLRLNELCRMPPYIHQVIGIDFLLRNQFAGLFDEMGAGKTFQTIVAACLLHLRGEIDNVIVASPAAVRAVWFHQELGELTKHLLNTVSAQVIEFHESMKHWTHQPEGTEPPKLHIYVTNYELLRKLQWLNLLLPLANRRTLLVCDESSAIKNWKADQTCAIREVRKKVGRIYLLNGTPVANNPIDMFAQGNLMSPTILDCGYITHYRARYCEMGGYMAETKWSDKKVATQIVGWKNLDDLQKRFAPYVIRRLKEDCLDLPPKLPAVTIPVTLDKVEWKHYKEMRDEMVTWLTQTSLVSAQQAMVKAIRLAQITSGFLSGVESMDEDADLNPEVEERPNWLPWEEPSPLPRGKVQAVIQEIGRSKLNILIDWTKIQLENDPALKLLIWSRFKPEVARCVEAFQAEFPTMVTLPLRGGQKKAERTEALKLLDPRYAPAGPATLFATSAGAMGFTFTASHTVVRLSRDFSMFLWKQGDDRVHRPGQTKPVSYFDFIAEGPKGQKTVDLTTLEALIGKLRIADFTVSAWVRELGQAA